MINSPMCGCLRDPPAGPMIAFGVASTGRNCRCSLLRSARFCSYFPALPFPLAYPLYHPYRFPLYPAFSSVHSECRCGGTPPLTTGDLNAHSCGNNNLTLCDTFVPATAWFPAGYCVHSSGSFPAFFSRCRCAAPQQLSNCSPDCANRSATPEVGVQPQSSHTVSVVRSSKPGNYASRWAGVPQAPADPILQTAIAFREETNPDKVNLGVGAYRDEQGKPYVFRCVRAAIKSLEEEPSYNMEYLPIDGLPELKKPVQRLAFGENFSKLDRVVSVQALSGTGSLRVGAEFLRRFVFPKEQYPGMTVYVSKPTWSNHFNIFRQCGFNVGEYTYWNDEQRGIDFPKMLADLESVPEQSIVILHACAHNPTGADLMPEQWSRLLELFLRRNLTPFFDMAYQGFASGSPDRDSAALRMFAEAIPTGLMLAQSFAKNMGLYGERVGMLHFVCPNEADMAPLLSQLKSIIRALYSSPPGNGAKILHRVLSAPDRKEEWLAEVKEVSSRLLNVRHKLYDLLVERKTPGDWSHITKQIGMFSYTGLTPAQCDHLTEKWGIYLLRSGRISLAGLNNANIDYVVEAIDDAVRTVQ